MAKIKYLVETSAVRAALGSSSTAHNRHFAEQVNDGKLWSSTYVRMEFIRRWFCDMVRMAATIEQCESVADALVILEQDLRPRSVKGMMAGIARLLKETGTIDNSRTAAEEIASQALRWLIQFDRVFASRIANLCKCQIGGRTPKVDYNHLLDDLLAFYESFITPITDCEVNAFLGLNDSRGRGPNLLQDQGVRRLPVGNKLADLAAEGRWITCRECSMVGDAVIALEQPPSWSLVHLDGAFNELCGACGRKHKQIKSVTALARESSQGGP